MTTLWSTLPDVSVFSAINTHRGFSVLSVSSVVNTK